MIITGQICSTSYIVTWFIKQNTALAVRKRRLRYLGHVLRMPADRMVRRSLMARVKGGTYYPVGSLLSDCVGEEMHTLEALAANRKVWRAKVASLNWTVWLLCLPYDVS